MKETFHPPRETKEPRFRLARKIEPASGDYHWIYLWEWPIRAMHWVAMICILGLTVTGLYIGKPYFIAGGDTADHFMMGWVRFVHFALATVFVATAIIRAYWLFAGNRFERLRALFPVRLRDWGNMWRQVKFYLMIQPEKAPHYLGHNPLQQLSYTGIYLAAALMVVTGFAMYGQSNPGGVFYGAFNWVGIVMGGMPVVRFVHHVLTWAFLIFIPIHVYLAIRADHLERTGVVSSIISGGRFVPADAHFIDAKDE
ncbi:MAG: Ni/Fe-hydrogenase, b-type cytochrome subunit [Gemmatimonadales bacterium]|nr:MAG: Ni/Fe-hydrogenase, b-type cytochrome subunit [Gemmatimonadales bacterium]